MPSVLFLRGFNVGGHKSFPPTAIAKSLAEFDAVNIGAAGTIVVRKKVTDSLLRAEVLRRLPMDFEFMICQGTDLLRLAADNPFRDMPEDREVNRYVTVLSKRPRTPPQFPILQPDPDWQVKILGIMGRIVISLQRRMNGRLIYPNEVVEKKFAVSATSRNWNTIEAICKVLSTE